MLRAEHPKPQFKRENWINLNGEWEFYIDNGNSGKDRKIFSTDVHFDSVINVPFCPQSKLSGVCKKDFLNSVWYKRTFNLTKEQVSGRIFIHFGAVDYLSTVYINGVECGKHAGGYLSFKFDISDYVHPGNNCICVNAVDDERNRLIPSGKQSREYYSHGCDYTRTTGIWQTVWLEFTPKNYIKSTKYYPSLDDGSVTVIADVEGNEHLKVLVNYHGQNMGEAEADALSGNVILSIKLKEKHLWEVGNGRLYDVILSYGKDCVKSYFGLRSISYSNHRFYLNGKSVFQRLILDQGFYPDGVYTAPADEDLEGDIDRSMAMGFNGARLHQKVFEERFLYHADKKGYLVWGEFPDWGLDHTFADSIYGILPEWLEEIERDFNHPSIVGWCPFNETWDINGRKQFDLLLENVYKATKAADPTRPCIDTSGNYHVITDIYDVHNYEQDVCRFSEFFIDLWDSSRTHENDRCEKRQKYDGKLPFFVSEYGGIRWSSDEKGWGYGEGPKSEEEFISRFKGLTDVLLNSREIFAFCYTQLTDVEQEQNGLFTYDRKPKFDKAVISEIVGRKAAVEE